MRVYRGHRLRAPESGSWPKSLDSTAFFRYNEIIYRNVNTWGENSLAMQLIADLYGCDPSVLDDPERIRAIAHRAVDALGAQIVEECMHRFEPIGVSYIAVITTSHFSVHTWPENGYAAVDVFSCAQDVPAKLSDGLAAAFGAKSCKTHTITRDLKGGVTP